MIFVGADPGINGALAALMCGDNQGPAFVSDAIDIPTMPDGKNREVDGIAIEAWLRKLPEWPNRVIIENVTPMPGLDRHGARSRGMGAVSAFRFGGAVLGLRMCFYMLRIRVHLVHAATWKAHFKLPGGDKETSRQLALQLHPEARHLLTRKKDHQRGEAILIARHQAELRGMIEGEASWNQTG